MPNLGFNQQILSRLSYISKKIIEQKFYEVPIADYIPIVIGEGAWSSNLIYSQELTTSSNFESGLINQGKSKQLLANVDVGLNDFQVKTLTFSNITSWTLPEVNQASLVGNWNIVESKVRALKKMWDLGIQEVAFLGCKSVPEVTGLLNNPYIPENLAVLTKPISQMTNEEFSRFLGDMLGGFRKISNGSSFPNRLILPVSDYFSLAKPYSDMSATSRLDVLENSLSKMVGSDFKVLPLKYADAEFNNLGVDRYVLYRYSEDVLRMDIPVDFHLLEPETLNGFLINQAGFGQFTGCTILRPQETMYFSVKKTI